MVKHKVDLNSIGAFLFATRELLEAAFDEEISDSARKFLNLSLYNVCFSLDILGVDYEKTKNESFEQSQAVSQDSAVCQSSQHSHCGDARWHKALKSEAEAIADAADLLDV